MACSTITLNFNYNNLGKEGYLVFIFDDEKIPGYQMYTDYFPVIWRVVQLRKTGIRRFPITFNRKYLLSTCHTRDDIVVTDQVMTQIKFKQGTKLEGDDKMGYDWSPPEPIFVSQNIVRAHNQTAKVQKISFCSEDESTSHVVPEPLLYIPDFGSSGTLDVEFKARLRIYYVPVLGITFDFLLPNLVDRVKITSPRLWDHLLDEQGLPDEWIITYNQGTGNLEINKSK